MEEEDSYSHAQGIPAFLGSPRTRALIYQSSVLQKRSLQDLYNQALILQCLKYLPAYQKTSHVKRVTPPVPKFEETHKKVKIEFTEELTVKHQLPMNCKYLPQIAKYNSELAILQAQGLENTNPNRPVEKGNVAKGTQDTLSYVLMTPPGQAQPQANANQDDFSLLSVKTEEEEYVKIEAVSDKSNESNETADSNEFLDAPLQTVTTPPIIENLDRKEKKKYQKFLELCEEYQTKLKISNALVFEKFKQLATLVIPRLLSHFKSKPFEAVAAAILLYACREVDYPITLKQIVSITDSKEKLINKCVFSLKEILPSNAEVKHFKAGEFINVLADKLKLNGHVRAAAIKIWENIERLNFMKSIHAVTLAACCLKFACSLSDSDHEFDTLALVAGITKMTLKNMYRELFPYRFHFITPDCMLRDPKELKKL